MDSRAPFPWSRRQVIDYALSQVRDGTLRIDDEGRIWRDFQGVRGGRLPITPRRAENADAKGYLRVTLGIPGTRQTGSVKAHRLIWEWANGPIPDDETQINHKDLDKQNNRLSNLELVTPSGNMRHSYAHGRTVPWSKQHERGGAWRGKPMLTDAQRQQMIALRKAGVFLKDIAAKFNCSQSHVHRIVSGVAQVDRSFGKGAASQC